MQESATILTSDVTIKSGGKEIKYLNVFCLIEKDVNSCINLYMDINPEQEFKKYRLYDNILKIYVLTDKLKLLVSVPHDEITFLSPAREFAATLSSIKDGALNIKDLNLHKPKGISLKLDKMLVTPRNTNEKVSANKPGLNKDQAEILKRKLKMGFTPYNTLKKRKADVPDTPVCSREISDDDDDDELEVEPETPGRVQQAQETPSRRVDARKMLQKAIESNNHLETLPVREIFKSERKPNMFSPSTRPVFFSSPINRNQCEEVEARNGFENLGNTCYINATLQALFNLPTFKRDLLDNKDRVHTNSGKTTLFQLFVSILKQKDVRTVVTPDKLVEFIRRSTTRFSSNTQEDADEFLKTLFDILEREFKGNMENMGNGAEEEDPIKKNFEFEIERMVECVDCKHVSSNTTIYRDLPLFLPKLSTSLGTITLHKLISNFFKTSSVSYACEKCPSTIAYIRQSIKKLPRILIVQLKRFDVDTENNYKLVKLNNPILFDKEISLQQWTSEENTKPPTPMTDDLTGIVTIDLTDDHPTTRVDYKVQKLNSFYNLQCVISHVGPTVNFGHYVCDVYDCKDMVWKCFDDSHMSVTGSLQNLVESRKNEGYLFFFVNKDFIN